MANWKPAITRAHAQREAVQLLDLALNSDGMDDRIRTRLIAAAGVYATLGSYADDRYEPADGPPPPDVVAAAKLRVKIDEQLGRITDPGVARIAKGQHPDAMDGIDG